MLRLKIIPLIVKGHEPEEAYRTAIAEIVAKAKPDAVRKDLESYGVQVSRLMGDPRSRYSDLQDVVAYAVVEGGGVEDVPSAECVRKKLIGIPSPTHADVNKAMMACREET